MLNLEFIAKESGDSILEGYEYSRGMLTINLNLSDIDMHVLIKIKTESMSFKNYYLDRLDVLYRTCRIEIKELANTLPVENSFSMGK
jgi:hypothetical protein